jgi:hypothetical protein
MVSYNVFFGAISYNVWIQRSWTWRRWMNTNIWNRAAAIQLLAWMMLKCSVL